MGHFKFSYMILIIVMLISMVILCSCDVSPFPKDEDSTTATYEPSDSKYNAIVVEGEAVDAQHFKDELGNIYNVNTAYSRGNTKGEAILIIYDNYYTMIIK